MGGSIMPSKARQLGTTVSSWTTSTRPTNPNNGQMGFNTTLGYIEWYSTTSNTWSAVGAGGGLSQTTAIILSRIFN